MCAWYICLCVCGMYACMVLYIYIYICPIMRGGQKKMAWVLLHNFLPFHLETGSLKEFRATLVATKSQ